MQKILHFHIPKTGGTTIRHYLIAQLGEKSVTPCVFDSRLSDALARWHDMPAISGHFALHQGDRLPADRYSMTVMRDPIDRFLSQYFFNRSDHADRLRNPKVHALDLDAYLENLSPGELEGLSCQLEMIYPLGTSVRTELSPNEKLEASIRGLESFDIVGLQDELEDFASMLDAKFSWPAATLDFKNVTSQRIHVSALTKDQYCKLKRSLEGEFELYERAKERFRQLRRDFIRRTISLPAVESQAACLEPTPAFPEEQPESVEFGDRRCWVQSVFVIGENSGPDRVMIGERCDIAINFHANEVIDELNIGIAIKDDRGFLVFGTNSLLLGNLYSIAPGEYSACFHTLNRAPIGRYRIDVSLVRRETHYQGCYHWLENAASFEVQESLATHFEGQVLMDADVELVATSPKAKVTTRSYAHSMHAVRSFGRNHPRLRRFDSQITPMSALDEFHPAHDAVVSVQLKNTGGEMWGAFGQQPVTLSYRWLAEDGEVVVADGLRTRLPADVYPEDAIVLPMKIRPPDMPGRFQLVFSLVQESVAWFVDEAPVGAHVFQVDLA